MATPDLEMDKATFIAFDTETTGLYPVSARLVEIGATRFTAAGDEIAVFEQLIDPESDIPPEVQQVNHITNQMVRGQPTVEAVMPRFLAFLGSSDTILIAQNAPFDVGFIGVDLIRLGLAFPTHLIFDTKLLAQAVMPLLPSYSLVNLATMLGISMGQKHRALADARLTRDVFLTLLAEAASVKTIADLGNLSKPIVFESSRIYETKPPIGFEDLASAIQQKHRIVMVYAGGTKGEEPREVTPRAILGYGGIVYLAAFCHGDAREKVYRLDRIKNYHLVPRSR
ncbi:MAG: exonuclease domain-containing protein [Candidatus Eisenbacteria bacterium]